MADTEEIATFKDSYSIPGLSRYYSHSFSNITSTVITGVDTDFKYAYSVYYFMITDKTIKIKITKDQLENLPPGYKFEDILVQ